MAKTHFAFFLTLSSLGWPLNAATIMGGFEFVRGFGPETNFITVRNLFEDSLKKQNVDVYPNYSIQPATGIIYFFTPDTDSTFEVAISPVLPSEAEQALSPLTEVSNKLGLTADRGGGHIHLDSTQFKLFPKQFVNMLELLNNNPRLEKIFRPIESKHDATLFHRGLQLEFVWAVKKFKELKNPTWEDVLRLFKDLYNGPGSIKIHKDTVEIRSIENQIFPKDGTLQLEFYNALWNASARYNKPLKRWSLFEYNDEFRVKNIERSLQIDLDLLGLNPQKYSRFIKKFAIERATQEKSVIREKNLDLIRRFLNPEISSTIIEELSFDHKTRKQKRLMWEAFQDASWETLPRLRKLVIKNLKDKKVLYPLKLLADIDWVNDKELRTVVLDVISSQSISHERTLSKLCIGRNCFYDPRVSKIFRRFLSPSRQETEGVWNILEKTEWYHSPLFNDALELAGSNTFSKKFALNTLKHTNWFDNSKLKNFVTASLNPNSPLGIAAESMLLAIEAPIEQHFLSNLIDTCFRIIQEGYGDQEIALATKFLLSRSKDENQEIIPKINQILNSASNNVIVRMLEGATMFYLEYDQNPKLNFEANIIESQNKIIRSMVDLLKKNSTPKWGFPKSYIHYAVIRGCPCCFLKRKTDK